MTALQLKDKRGHREREFDVAGARGSRFRVLLRQSASNVLDFSVILLFLPKGTNLAFRLRRYNGKSHEHGNRIERDKFYAFHVHTATERYQDVGMSEDSYAEPTDRFCDLGSAIECLRRDCAFLVEGGQQPGLFEEVE
jgi:hypothetical protein